MCGEEDLTGTGAYLNNAGVAYSSGYTSTCCGNQMSEILKMESAEKYLFKIPKKLKSKKKNKKMSFNSNLKNNISNFKRRTTNK